jgi:hypothetical protein
VKTEAVALRTDSEKPPPSGNSISGDDEIVTIGREFRAVDNCTIYTFKDEHLSI